MKAIWQLPVKQSNLTNKDWVNYKAKPHAYVNSNESLCGKYSLSDYFEQTDLESLGKEFGDYRHLVCKTCLKKFEKLLEREERAKPRYQVVIEASSIEEAIAIQLQIAEFDFFGKINIIKGKG